MKNSVFLLMTVLCFAGSGCDERKDVPLNTEVPEPPKPAATAPTTQQLKEQPRQTLQLATFPLTVSVPKSWKIELTEITDLDSGADPSLKLNLPGRTESSSSISLSGWGSSGRINIQLINGPKLTQDYLKTTLAKLQKDADAKPHPVNRVRQYSLSGGASFVIEQRMISNHFENGKLPPEVWGDVVNTNKQTDEKLVTRHILNPHMLKWTLTVCIPSTEPSDKGKYITRTLSFSDLSLREFTQDREFLEEMLASLKTMD